MDEDRKVTTIRETSIGDFCDHCGQYLKEHCKQCPNCNYFLIIDKEEIDKNVGN